MEPSSLGSVWGIFLQSFGGLRRTFSDSVWIHNTCMQIERGDIDIYSGISCDNIIWHVFSYLFWPLRNGQWGWTTQSSETWQRGTKTVSYLTGGFPRFFSRHQWIILRLVINGKYMEVSWLISMRTQISHDVPWYLMQTSLRCRAVVATCERFGPETVETCRVLMVFCEGLVNVL